MKIKRTFALLFVAIMLFSFTACNGTNDNSYTGLWKPVSFEIDGKGFTLEQLQEEQKTQEPDEKKVDDGFRITLEENNTAIVRLSNDEKADNTNEIKTTWTVVEGNDTTSDKIKVNGKECSLENGQLVYQYSDTVVITLEKVDVVSSSLAIMGKGMLGIFATVIIVMIVVFVLSKTNKKKDA